MPHFIKYTNKRNNRDIAINFDRVYFIEPGADGGTIIAMSGEYTITVTEEFESVRQQLWFTGLAPDE